MPSCSGFFCVSSRSTLSHTSQDLHIVPSIHFVQQPEDPHRQIIISLFRPIETVQTVCTSLPCLPSGPLMFQPVLRAF